MGGVHLYNNNNLYYHHCDTYVYQFSEECSNISQVFENQNLALMCLLKHNYIWVATYIAMQSHEPHPLCRIMPCFRDMMQCIYIKHGRIT